MPIQHVWTEKREETFDLERFALGVLERAMDCLESDGYLQSAVFVVSTKALHCYSVSFQGFEQKDAAYNDVVTTAKELKAEAIVTLNDAYTGDAETYDPDTYEWGQLAKKHSGECIFVSVTGPELENWCAEAEYRREQGHFVFSEPKISHKEALGLLGEWAKAGQRVN